MNSGIFKGDISLDSPVLAGAIFRHLPKDSHARVVAAFRDAVERGACVEAGIPREKEVSFNPRPARLAVILINELGIYSPDAVTACFALSLSGEKLSGFDSAASSLASEAVRLKSDSSLSPSSVEAEALALVSILDEVRHLHMSSLPLSERKKRCTELEAWSETRPFFPHHDRIVRMIDAALKRVREYHL